MGPQLRLSIVVDEAAAVLVLGGELDLATVRQLERALQTVTASSAPRVIVDTSEVEFCDVTNLRLLVATASSLVGQGRQLVLRNPRRFFLRLLDLADTRRHVAVDSSPGDGDSTVSIAEGA